MGVPTNPVYATLCRDLWRCIHSPYYGRDADSLFQRPCNHQTGFYRRPRTAAAGQANSRVFRLFVGPNSLLVLDGARHKRERRLLMPPFHGERMRLYGDMMCEITDRMDRYVAAGDLVSNSLTYAGNHSGHYSARRFSACTGCTHSASAHTDDRNISDSWWAETRS